MKKEYIVTNDYLSQKGLDLNNYAIDGTSIQAIINDGLDLLVTRIAYLDDRLGGADKDIEEEIANYIDEHPKKLGAFLKAQYRVIYNLVFQAETSPTDPFVDNIIVHELGLGKINGFQKGVFYKQ